MAEQWPFKPLVGGSSPPGPTSLMQNKKLPAIIQEVGFDFSWSEEKVWTLTVPVEEMNIAELTWHFDIPFWSTPEGYYDLTPHQVLANPEKHAAEYERILKADMQYPLDIMYWKSRWLLLDGLHRLVKTYKEGMKTINVRRISTKFIEQIVK